MSVFSKAKSFFAAHKAARVMLAAVILLALVLLINFCSSRIAKLMMKGRE